MVNCEAFAYKARAKDTEIPAVRAIIVVGSIIPGPDSRQPSQMSDTSF